MDEFRCLQVIRRQVNMNNVHFMCVPLFSIVYPCCLKPRLCLDKQLN
jgi:hypothetical protein